MCFRDSPYIPIRIHGREWYAAGENLEFGLPLQHNLAHHPRGYRLGESHYGIVGNDVAGSDEGCEEIFDFSPQRHSAYRRCCG